MEQLPYELRAWPESGHVGLEQQTTLPWNNCPLEQPSYNHCQMSQALNTSHAEKLIFARLRHSSRVGSGA